MRCGELHILIQDILETSVRFYGDTNNTNIQTVLASRNTQRREEQIIISTILCQVTGSLLQERNDETKKILGHACKAKWDGIHSRYTVSNKYHQHGRGKNTHHEKSTIKEATKVVPVWIH